MNPSYTVAYLQQSVKCFMAKLNSEDKDEFVNDKKVETTKKKNKKIYDNITK